MTNRNDPNGNRTRDQLVAQCLKQLRHLHVYMAATGINVYREQDRLHPLSLRLTLLLVAADESRRKLTVRVTPSSHTENVKASIRITTTNCAVLFRGIEWRKKTALVWQNTVKRQFETSVPEI